MATPARRASFEFLRLKMPNGRFWIGKSQPGAFADSTQLLKLGSCVSSKMGTDPIFLIWKIGVRARLRGRFCDHAARQFLESQLLFGRQGYGAHRFHSSIAKSAVRLGINWALTPLFQKTGLSPSLTRGW